MPERINDNTRTLLLGVFFTFAPGGLLFCLLLQPPATWVLGLLSAAFFGLVSTGWAAAFITRRLWLLALVIPGSYLIPRYGYPAAHDAAIFTESALSPLQRQLVLVVMALASMAAGHILIVRFIRGRERSHARAKAELDLAAKVHADLVPPIAVNAGVAEVFGRSDASSEMGGDLIDVRQRPGEVDLFLADVSGHGVAAGLVMGMLKAAMHTSWHDRPPLDVLVARLNGVLSELVRPGMFATFACVRVTQGAAEYALAGHLPILVWRTADSRIDELPNEHLPLAVEENERFGSGRIAVSKGDVLVLFTDGLSETQDARGALLGMDPLRAALRRAGNQPLERLHAELLAAARSHGSQTDDQSILLARVA